MTIGPSSARLVALSSRLVAPSSTRLVAPRTSNGKSGIGAPDVGRASDRKHRSPLRTTTSSEISAAKRPRCTAGSSFTMPTSLALPDLKDMYHNPASAAQLFSRIEHPGILGAVVCGETFTGLSFCDMRFLAYVNKMGHEFEAKDDDERQRVVQARRATTNVQVNLDDALNELDVAAKKQGKTDAEKALLLAKMESTKNEV